ncbi:MAG: hypothetical protein HYY96_03820 [Candidatus Tectomicrobia bacterium]|nr:hypothetical protein [Candidatus Tectomicrobia bacterium]
MRDLFEQHLEKHALPKKKPKSVYEDRRLANQHILPRLGSRRVAEVTRADVAQLHHSSRSAGAGGAGEAAAPEGE